jgi:hypothetical protein
MQPIEQSMPCAASAPRFSSVREPRVAIDSKGVDTARARRNLGGAPPVP